MTIFLMIVGYLLAAGGVVWLIANHGGGWVENRAQAIFLGIAWPAVLLVLPILLMLHLLDVVARDGFRQR